MNIDKMLEIEILYSQYASLLTEKQREIVSLYYEEDYSLGEISQMLNISRQSVYDSLKRSEKSLADYEKKLGIVAKTQKIENILDKIDKKVEVFSRDFEKYNAEDSTQFKDLLDEIRELL